MTKQQQTTKRIGLIKRVLVMVYDGLLLFSVLFITSAIWMAVFNALAPESLYVDPSKLADKKLADFTDLGRTLAFLLVALNIIGVSFFFYGWFWTHGGQTLGMRAWSLYLTDPNGKFISWPVAAQRYSWALISWVCGGLGFLWILGHPKRMAWHDLLTNTQIVFHKPRTPKPSGKS